MCGIAGFINSNGKASEKDAQAMIDAIAHRGPDDQGLYVRDEIALGHRRLSILDTSSAGHEPMVYEGRYWMTFNGEIYNYLELKKELPERTYLSDGDAEVLMHAYATWGPECVKKFNGIFALAIWDTKEKTLFLARDHVGVKPLYYAQQNGVVYFSSEIKAILAGGFKTNPNESVIYEYLVHGTYDHSPETFFSGVLNIPPGHSLTVANGNMKLTQYWNLKEHIWDTRGWSDEKVQGTFRELFEDAVRIQLRADVPVGLHVSGGIDSSILAHAINKANDGQKNFRMFSFAYAGSSYDEEPYVNDLAKALGWQVSITHLSPDDVNRLIESATWHQDMPFSGLPTLALQHLVESYKDSDIKVILEGQGGDEVAAGYEYYIGAYWLDIAREKGEAEADKQYEAFAKIRGFKDAESKKSYLKNAIDAYKEPGSSADGSRFVKPEVLNQDFLSRAKVERKIFEAPFESALANMQYRDLFHTKLPRILRSCDRASMAYGRELRVPLLDYRLLEFSLGLDLYQKIRNGEQRFFVRDAYRPLLPKHIVEAPKRAVVNPQREWFQKELRPMIETILNSHSFAALPYFNKKAVLDEYQEYCSEPQKNSFHVWQWINLALWHKAFFE